MAQRLLHFKETSIFTKQIDKLASIEILTAMQDELIENPERGAIITGTGGARKGRIGDRAKKRGKSGSFRYIYVYFERAGIIYLLLFYSKNEQDTMNDEQKKEVAAFIRQAKKNLEK